MYEAKNPDRNDWADWLYENHIFIVADNAVRLAKRFGGRQDLARAAALLHDLADAKMSRFSEGHDEATLDIAREVMQKAGFSKQEIEICVDDAVRYHSCHDGHAPSSVEGKVMATADALAHLQTDFYVYALWALGRDKPLEKAKTWALKKIDRDFNNKILFDEIKGECRPDYEHLVNVFGR